MKSEDKEEYLSRYNSYYEKYGNDSKSLGWGGGIERQFIRFSGMLSELRLDQYSSIVDVGCGFGDLKRFFETSGAKHLNYLGIDINSNFIHQCEENLSSSNTTFLVADKIPQREKRDIVFACGIFNAKLKSTDNLKYIQDSLIHFVEHAKHLVIVDFLSPFVDYEQELSFHPNLNDLIPIIKALNLPFDLKFNYLPYEFSLRIYCD